MDGSCVCACSCLPLSPWGASPLFPHSAPEVNAAPSLDHALLRPRYPGGGGELGESRRRGSKQSWSDLSELEIQNRALLLLRVHAQRHKYSSLVHAHVHLLLCSRGIPGFLVNTVQVNRLPVWHTEIRSDWLHPTVVFTAEHKCTSLIWLRLLWFHLFVTTLHITILLYSLSVMCTSSLLFCSVYRRYCSCSFLWNVLSSCITSFLYMLAQLCVVQVQVSEWHVYVVTS